MMSNTAKTFDILAISLSILHNYFNGPTKLFLDLANRFLDLAKFLDSSAKPSFLCQILFLVYRKRYKLNSIKIAYKLSL